MLFGMSPVGGRKIRPRVSVTEGALNELSDDYAACTTGQSNEVRSAAIYRSWSGTVLQKADSIIEYEHSH